MAQAAYVQRLSDGVFEMAHEEECRLGRSSPGRNSTFQVCTMLCDSA